MTATYRGRDNLLDWVLRADDHAGAVSLVDASSFDRFVLQLGGATLDSAQLGLGAGQVFDNTEDAEVEGQTVKRLRIRLGATDLAAGTYPNARLVAYDALHINGLVWADNLTIEHKR